MNDMQRIATLLQLIGAMKAKGSWCGETHIQKSTYLLQNLLQVRLNHRFVFYKHGPYSFDLHDELVSLRADRLLRLSIVKDDYGPSWELTDAGKEIIEQFKPGTEDVSEGIEFVAEHVGSRGVAELERLSTALYVSLKNWEASVQDRAEALHTLKPHVPMDLALAAVRTLDEFRREATLPV